MVVLVHLESLVTEDLWWPSHRKMSTLCKWTATVRSYSLGKTLGNCSQETIIHTGLEHLGDTAFHFVFTKAQGAFSFQTLVQRISLSTPFGLRRNRGKCGGSKGIKNMINITEKANKTASHLHVKHFMANDKDQARKIFTTNTIDLKHTFFCKLIMTESRIY